MLGYLYNIFFSEEPRHVIKRPWVVYISSIVLLLTVFFFFVIIGWPGGPIGCIYKDPHDCYCEAFELEDVENNEPGVRQPVNTWTSLISILTSGIIAWRMSEDRKQLYEKEEERKSDIAALNNHSSRLPNESFRSYRHRMSQRSEAAREEKDGSTPNVMKSNNLIADWYVLTSVFSGLGKMYFHGSLVRWAVYVDGVSSNFFYAYLPWYTFRRIYRSDTADITFWIGYYLTIVIISLSQIVFGSLLAAHIFMIFYFFMELYIFATTGVFLGTTKAKCIWFFNMGMLLVAVIFWWSSQTGRFMCDPESPWQIHGLIWHPAFNVAVVLFYFYWREAGPAVTEGEEEEEEESAEEREEKRRAEAREEKRRAYDREC